MKAAGICEARRMKNSGVIILTPMVTDKTVFNDFFDSKEKKEEKTKTVICLKTVLIVPGKERTYKQNNALWELITILYEANYGKVPTEAEKYNLYLDIIEMYADRVPSSLTGELRPVRISESDVFQAAKLIEGCIEQLAEVLAQVDDGSKTGRDRYNTLQINVKQIIDRWYGWRGNQEEDPLDYSDFENKVYLTEEQWRELHAVSEASHKGGDLQKCHIVSKGSSGIEEPWDWLALLPEEHKFQHDQGWEKFLSVFPHLKGKVERARRIAGKKGLL